jgi:hypothetical protein
MMMNAPITPSRSERTQPELMSTSLSTMFAIAQSSISLGIYTIWRDRVMKNVSGEVVSAMGWLVSVRKTGYFFGTPQAQCSAQCIGVCVCGVCGGVFPGRTVDTPAPASPAPPSRELRCCGALENPHGRCGAAPPLAPPPAVPNNRSETPAATGECAGAVCNGAHRAKGV